MGGKNKYINIFCSFTEPFNCELYLHYFTDYLQSVNHNFSFLIFARAAQEQCIMSPLYGEWDKGMQQSQNFN